MKELSYVLTQLFFFLQNSPLLFSITRSSSFSVIHVSVNIKNNVEKDTTLLLFFLSKSPSDHAISFQIKPWVAFGLPYLLIELFYIGMPVVRTDGRAGGRAGGRCTVTWLPNFLGWVTIFLPMVLRCARLARETSALTPNSPNWACSYANDKQAAYYMLSCWNYFEKPLKM